MLAPPMPSARARICLATVLVAASGVVATSGCNFEVPSPTYISQTKLISVRGEVVELGGLNPARVGVPYEAAIAEAMPDDRYAFEAVVVAPDGHVLAGDEIESLWFQCGVNPCGARGLSPSLPEFDRPCDELDDWTLDELCRLAAGDHRVEFEVPPLGPELIELRVAAYFGVFAWNGRTAEDCWADRRARDVELDGCGFIERPVKIGPSWWMLAYAESIGLESPIPIWQIPIAVYGQFANRIPAPTIHVQIDGVERGSWPETARFVVAPGSVIEVDSEYDETQQFTQSYFLASFDTDSWTYWFRGGAEYLLERGFSTQTIHARETEIPGTRAQEWVVDPYAEAGSAHVFVVFFDDRYGEGVARLEFEVQP